MIESKQFAELIGFEVGDDSTIEDVKKYFDETFVGVKVINQRPDLVNHIVGKRLGSLETAVYSNFKEAGFEFSPDEKKDRTVEELIALGAKKVSGKLSEIEEKSKHSTDKRLTDLQSEYAKVKNDYTQIADSNKAISAEMDKLRLDSDNEKKQFQLSYIFNEAYTKLPFSEQVDAVRHEDFKAAFSAKYNLDFEGETPIVRTKNGEFVQNVAKSGYETIEGVLKKEADLRGMIKKNEGGKPPVRTGGFQYQQPAQQPQPSANGTTVRKAIM